MNADKPPGDVDFPMTPRAKSYLNELAAAIRSIWPLNGGNVVITDALGGRGKIFNAASAKKGGAGGAACELGASLVKDGTADKIEFDWGTIVGRQPTGFSAGGSPPYRMAAAANTYYYAAADFDWSSMQWTSARIESSEDPFKENTDTTAYTLLSSVGVSDGKLTIQGGCGNVWFTPCDLVFSS